MLQSPTPGAGPPPPLPLEGGSPALFADPLAWAAAHGFGLFDACVLALNVLLFVFATPLVRASGGSGDQENVKRRAWMLRLVNLLLFLLYFVAYFVSDLARPLAQTGLTILIGSLAGHLANVISVRRYGREREIEGVVHRSGTYHSQLFTMILVGVVVITCGLVILQIWGRDNWLQATSVIGGLLVALYATKDVWLPDNIAALILLHDGDVQPGTLVRCEELGLLGIALRTTLTRTIFKDLVQRHEVVVPNRRLRSARLELLSKGPEAGIWDHADFKIGYDAEPEAVRAMLVEAHARAAAAEKAISTDKDCKVRVVETGDHAVTWRLFWVLRTPYNMLPARFQILDSALAVSRECGIGLDTPLTHRVGLRQESGG